MEHVDIETVLIGALDADVRSDVHCHCLSELHVKHSLTSDYCQGLVWMHGIVLSCRASI